MITVADVNFYRNLYSNLMQRIMFQTPFKEGEIHRKLLIPCNEIIRNRTQIDTNMINFLYQVMCGFYKIIMNYPDTDEGADVALKEIDKMYRSYKGQLPDPVRSLFVNLVIILSDDAFVEKRRIRNNTAAG